MNNKSRLTAVASGALSRICLACLAFLIFLLVAASIDQFTTSSGIKYLVADDSMITLRVAKNIAAGIGPFFNPGERVSTATSLTWPYLLSPLFIFFSAPKAVLLASVLSLVVTFAIFAVMALMSSGPIAFALAAISLVLASPLRAYGASA